MLLDLRTALQGSKNDFEMEKKRSNDLADLLSQKTKQCVKIQVPLIPLPVSLAPLFNLCIPMVFLLVLYSPVFIPTPFRLICVFLGRDLVDNTEIRHYTIN